MLSITKQLKLQKSARTAGLASPSSSSSAATARLVLAGASRSDRPSPKYPPVTRGEGGAFRTADEQSADLFWEREDALTPLSGEWPPTHAFGNYEAQAMRYKEEAKKALKGHYHPSTPVFKVMSTNVLTCHPEDKLETIKHLFQRGVSGLPVVMHDGRVVGILSKSDLKNKVGGPDSLVRELMTRGAWVVSDSASVEVCAAMMLKHKVHRLPVLDRHDHLCGIVTRTDVFTALAQDAGAEIHNL